MNMELNDYLKLSYPITMTMDADGDWIAEIETLEGCVAHGETPQEAIAHVGELKGHWIEEALKIGKHVPVPDREDVLPSGKWLQRVPRSLHRQLVRLAKNERSSLNQLVSTILSNYVGTYARQDPLAATANVVLAANTMVNVWSISFTPDSWSGAAITAFSDMTPRVVLAGTIHDRRQPWLK
jgi:antitoxin HicB